MHCTLGQMIGITVIQYLNYQQKIIVTPRCKPIPMPDDIIEVVNQIGEIDGLPNGIVFCNILKEPTIDDMYRDINSQDNSSCASNKSWNMPKYGGQVDQKNIVYNDAVDNDKIDNLNKDGLDLQNGLGDNINNGNKKI